MNQPILTSHPARIWIQIGLAVILALALATYAHAYSVMASSNNQSQGCEGLYPEMCLRWGPDYAAKIIPVTGIRNNSDFANNQAEGCEGINSEMCLRWGLNYGSKTIPVTGSIIPSDFGYNYWLVVGPAGEQPFDGGLANR